MKRRGKSRSKPALSHTIAIAQLITANVALRDVKRGQSNFCFRGHEPSWCRVRRMYRRGRFHCWFNQNSLLLPMTAIMPVFTSDYVSTFWFIIESRIQHLTMPEGPQEFLEVALRVGTIITGLSRVARVQMDVIHDVKEGKDVELVGNISEADKRGRKC
ncbi:hypothetical protein DFH94DRAFT_774908 [Russula ochroleuca]|uniref:Uncharacterized protein n=1 Tax=Russula ochroleuca TaxID=152965 RepID=A0A9P5JXV9_9AGAM|nr:hypothetical protein DFH94DRAFT_774908 [Russula ochroleuca]